MVQANPETGVEDESSEAMVVNYDDLELLQTDGVDSFVLNLNGRPTTPPYFVDVDGRRFSLLRETFLVRGHGATMPQWIREQEAEGRLVLLAERSDRYLVYLWDPNADGEDDDE